MIHYMWIKGTFNIMAFDDNSQSILFDADGEICCEINGHPMDCDNVEDFWEMVDFFKDETFEI